MRRPAAGDTPGSLASPLTDVRMQFDPDNRPDPVDPRQNLA